MERLGVDADVGIAIGSSSPCSHGALGNGFSSADQSSSEVDIDDLVEDEDDGEDVSNAVEGSEGGPEESLAGDSLHDSILGLEGSVASQSDDSGEESKEQCQDEGDDVILSGSHGGGDDDGLMSLEFGVLVIGQECVELSRGGLHDDDSNDEHDKSDGGDDPEAGSVALAGLSSNHGLDVVDVGLRMGQSNLIEVFVPSWGHGGPWSWWCCSRWCDDRWRVQR